MWKVKSTNIRKLIDRGLESGQAILVRYIYATRPLYNRDGKEIGRERTPIVKRREVLLTAAQWGARYRERRRVKKRWLRRQRRAHRRGALAKRS